MKKSVHKIQHWVRSRIETARLSITLQVMWLSRRLRPRLFVCIWCVNEHGPSSYRAYSAIPPGPFPAAAQHYNYIIDSEDVSRDYLIRDCQGRFCAANTSSKYQFTPGDCVK